MSEQLDSTKLKVRYEELSAKYASQVIVNTTKEEIILDFSSGVVPDPETGDACVPVHTRIAISKSGAKRLQGLLSQALGDS